MATMLFIDDEPSTLELLSQAVTMLGHKALTATSKAEALSLAVRHQPALILIDINLDGSHDLDFIDQLHQNPKTLNIPVITLSALQPVEAETIARSHGAVASLSKPLRLHTLLELFNEYT